jgi:hypothetical protein
MEALMFHNPMGPYGPLQGWLYLLTARYKIITPLFYAMMLDNCIKAKGNCTGPVDKTEQPCTYKKDHIIIIIIIMCSVYSYLMPQS